MSLFDMIPDKEMIMPARGTHGTTRLAQKNFGLSEWTCAYCGEKFYHRSRTVEYIRYKKSKTVRFCSWNHMCEWEGENPPRKKGGSTKTLQERIDFRMLRMVADRALLNSEDAAQMSEKEIQKIKNRLAWDAKSIRELEEELELEAGKSV